MSLFFLQGYLIVKLLLVITILSVSFNPIYCSIQCKNELDKPVDWFIAYKIPKESKNYHANGLEFVYISSESSNNDKWIQSNYLVNDSRSLIGATLSPLYQSTAENNQANHLLYSDQPRKGEKFSDNGHSKGVILFDSSTGLWLIHSVPSFPIDPSTSNNYDYPSTGEINGQLFLCISFNTQSMLSQISEPLLYVRPHIYSSNISPSYLQQYQQLNDLINKRWVKQPYRQIDLTTLGGKLVSVFGKSPITHFDIYSELIATNYKKDFLVESWRKGAGGPLPSECDSTYRVNNVDQVKLDYGSKTFSWSYTEDHSKWAISIASDEPIACIGDVNRMNSQFKRGGGVICINDSRVWSALRSSVQSVEPCPKGVPFRKGSWLSRLVNFFTRLFTSKFSLPAKAMIKEKKSELR